MVWWWNSIPMVALYPYFNKTYVLHQRHLHQYSTREKGAGSHSQKSNYDAQTSLSPIQPNEMPPLSTGDPERDPDLVHARPYLRKSVLAPKEQYDPFLVR